MGTCIKCELKGVRNLGSLSNSVDEEFEEGIKRLIVA